MVPTGDLVRCATGLFIMAVRVRPLPSGGLLQFGGGEGERATPQPNFLIPTARNQNLGLSLAVRQVRMQP
jgi:hypothetical protein